MGMGTCQIMSIALGPSLDNIQDEVQLFTNDEDPEKKAAARMQRPVCSPLLFAWHGSHSASFWTGNTSGIEWDPCDRMLPKGAPSVDPGPLEGQSRQSREFLIFPTKNRPFVGWNYPLHMWCIVVQ